MDKTDVPNEAVLGSGFNDGLGAWQPIETMPRTGKMVLMWSRKVGFFAGKWPQGCAAGDWHKINGDWRGGFDRRAQEATHWMPLPAPPRKAPNAEFTGRLRSGATTG